MKNVYEVLKQKELEYAMVRRQVECLRFVAPLLQDDVPAAAPASEPEPKPEGVTFP